jgi:hypothetical protein
MMPFCSALRDLKVSSWFTRQQFEHPAWNRQLTIGLKNRRRVGAVAENHLLRVHLSFVSDFAAVTSTLNLHLDFHFPTSAPLSNVWFGPFSGTSTSLGRDEMDGRF